MYLQKEAKDEVASLARPGVVDLPQYDPWFDIMSTGADSDALLDLSSNESPFSPSPKVAEVLATLAPQVVRYPDPTCRALRNALARHTSLPSNRIAIGNGAENLIELICQALLCPGDRVVTQAPCYALHDIHPQAAGARVDKVPMDRGLRFDVQAWKHALRTPAKLVMFSNPSNPVGCILSQCGFQELVAATPRGALLVVDEAYGEYARGHGDYPDALTTLLGQPRPWLILRTFSKAYGLAGLRVGYALASDARIVTWLDRVRSPYNVNHAAQKTALAALLDPGHMQNGVQEVHRLREVLARQLRDVGYFVAPSLASFLYINVGEGAGVAVAENLREHGIAVKPWREAGYTSFIRVTVGRQEENERFLAALAEVSPQLRNAGCLGLTQPAGDLP